MTSPARFMAGVKIGTESKEAAFKQAERRQRRAMQAFSEAPDDDHEQEWRAYQDSNEALDRRGIELRGGMQ